MPVEQGDAVSDRTKRGHEGCRYGDTGDNGATFLAGCLKHARDAAEQGYQHVVNGRIGPCEQFRGVAEVQRAQYEEQGGGGNTDGNHDEIILQREFDQPVVPDTQAEAEAEYGPHHR